MGRCSQILRQVCTTRAPILSNRSRTVPVRARKGIGLTIERLGAFEAADRRDASDVIQRIGIDGMDAMVRALGHATLAVRAAVYEQLTRRLTTEQRLAPAALPIYDAWAPARQWSKMAVEWQRWWAEHRRRSLVPKLLADGLFTRIVAEI